MAIGGIFGRARSRTSDADVGNRPLQIIARDDVPRRLELLDDFEESGLGWFWATDVEGRLVYLSDKAAEQLGKPIQDIIGEPLGSLFSLNPLDEDDAPERPLSFLLSTRAAISDLTVRIANRGRATWWLVSGRPQLDASGAFKGYRGSAKDVTAVYEQQRDASRLSQYDSLTGLANRHRMGKRLGTILTSSQPQKRGCALMMLDLDRFKQVNDTLGHPAGDELLKQVALRLKRVVGPQAEIGRLGGDEFQVILPAFDDREKLGDLASRVIQMISQPYSIDGSRAIIGTSVGIAVAPWHGTESADLVRNADLALYSAKGAGRGQYRFYAPDMKNKAAEHRAVEEDLRDALARGELQLYYQPVVRSSDSVLTGFEALMRWNHPERGSVSPAVFIPVAEETNLISQLGEWALRQACQDAAAWPGRLRIAVNVSANQFSGEGLPAIVASALANSGLDSDRLELEITESVFMGHAEAVDRMFASLKQLGVRLALDDFGTGYSSLGYLRRAPFDKIKIDKSFVRGCTDPTNSNSAIISAVIGLAEALNMETTAEGVEANDELEIMRKTGATYIQGYIFSKPIPNDLVTERLGDGSFQFETAGERKHRAERRTVFRRIVVIHGSQRYDVMMRNISKTGALIEGLSEVPVGTKLVLDLGAGELAPATVRRSDGDSQGVQFDAPLASEGGEVRTGRTRKSRLVLAET